MLKKSIYILFICLTAQVFPQNTETLKAQALRDAKEATQATLKEDFKKLLTYTHQNILDAAGGAEVMESYLKTTFAQMKADGFTYEVAETKAVSDVVKEQGEYRCYVENYIVMVMKDKRIFSTSYMLGFYNETTKRWSFVEAKEMKNTGSIIAYFPDFKTNINIPENTMKMEDI